MSPQEIWEKLRPNERHSLITMRDAELRSDLYRKIDEGLKAAECVTFGYRGGETVNITALGRRVADYGKTTDSQ